MRIPTLMRPLAVGMVTSILATGCGESDPGGPAATAIVTGVVRTSTGSVIQGATVSVGSSTTTTGADGRFEIRNLQLGSVTISTSAPLFDSRSESVSLVEGVNTHDVVLTPQPRATASGVVTATTGAVIQGASVTIRGVTATTGADGRFEIQNLPIGGTTLATSATGFVPLSQGVNLVAGSNSHDVVLTPAGQWGLRAPLLDPLSELALAEAGGKLYLLGGYPNNRVTSRTVQVYDIGSNIWSYGPQLPQPNNHGMAASVGGKVYLIGGQTLADDPPGTNSYVNTVWELDPATSTWVAKAPMPTARSSGVAIVHDGKIYVAGGRPPREKDFAVYDPATNTWETLPELPSQRNHMTGAAINGRIHVVGGRIGLGLGIAKTAVHEVYNPLTRTWTSAAPMPRARSGMNSIMAKGCFHVWGGESAQEGMFPDHDYYDPRTNQWASLLGMPLPVHGVNGSAFVDGLIRVAGGGNAVGGSWGTLLNQVYRPDVSCE